MAVLFVLTVSVLFTTVFQVTIMIFVTLSLILKNFSLGAGWNAKIQCFSLTYVIANHLNFKYMCTLTKDVGVSGSSLSGCQLKTFHP